MGSLFSPPKTPKVEAPPPMPSPEIIQPGELEAERRRRELAMQYQGGRTSTMLSERGGDRLGG